MQHIRNLAVAMALLLLAAACGGGVDATPDESETTVADADEGTSTTSEPMGTRVLDGTLLEAIEGIGSTSHFLDVALAHGVGGDFGICERESDGSCGFQWTVFAPTNGTLEGAVAELGAAPHELAGSPKGEQLVLSHIAWGDLAETDAGRAELETLWVDPLAVVVGDDGSIEFPDHPHVRALERIEVDNGVVYVIEGMLAGGLGCTEGPVEPDAVVCGDLAVDELGTSITFTTEHEWFARFAEPGVVILEDQDRDNPTTRAVLMLNADPIGAATVGELFDGLDGIEIVAEADVSVGGVDATEHTVTYGGGDVVDVLATDFLGPIHLRGGEVYKVWDVATEPRIVIFSPVETGDEQWFAKADAIVDTIEFGEAVAASDGGDAGGTGPDFAEGEVVMDDFALGALTMTLPEPAVVEMVHPGFVVVSPLVPSESVPRPGVAIIAPNQTGSGEPLVDAESILAAFGDRTDITEGDPVEVFGQVVPTWLAADRARLPSLSPLPVGEDPSGLDVVLQDLGRDVVVDTPAGPLVISVGAFVEDELEMVEPFFTGLVPGIRIDG